MAAPFVPTIDNLQDGSPWLNLNYNTLINDVQSALVNNDGTILVTPLAFTKSGQDLNGGRNVIYNFKRMFGTDGGAQHRVAVRDAMAFMPNADPDSFGIQAAINDLPAAGGIVLLPPGVYECALVSNLAGTSGSARQNVLLLGFGSSTILTYPDTFQTQNYILNMGEGVTSTHHAVMGVRFDGRSSYQTTWTNSFINTSNNDSPLSSILIEHCDFVNLKGDAIYNTGASNVMIRGCRFKDVTGDSVRSYPSDTRSNFAVDAAISSGTSLNHRIQIAIASTRTMSRVHVRHCVLSGGAAAIIYIAQGGITSQINDVCIHGNIMSGGGESSSGALQYGAVHFQNAYATCKMFRNEIRNNLIVNRTEGDGVNFVITQPEGVSAFASNIKDVNVSGNVITSIASMGANSGQHGGSFWMGPPRNPTIACNVIGNCGSYGVYFEGTDYYFNSFHTTRGSVFGNAIFDDRKGEATMLYGVAFATNAGASGVATDYNAAIGNAVFGTTTGAVLDDGIGNDVAHNTYGK